MNGRGRVGVTAPTDTAALEAHRDGLYARLEEGYERIERSLAERDLETDWTGFWTQMLAEYESVCERLQRDLAG